MNRFKLLVLSLFLASIALRLILQFADRNGDVYYFSRWISVFNSAGATSFYELDFNDYGVVPVNYPPVIVLSFLLINRIYQFASGYFGSLPIFEDFLKFPALFADMIGVGVIYFLLRAAKVNYKKAVLIALVYFVHPLTIYLSSLWGQTDLIPTSFILLSALLIIRRKAALWVGLSLLVSILVKQTVVVFIPILLFCMLFRYPLRENIKALFVCLILLYISFIPFSPSTFPFYNPVQYYQKYILSVSGMPYTSNNAFNLWYQMHGGISRIADAAFVGGLTYTHFSYILLLTVILLSCYAIKRASFSSYSILLSLFAVAFTSFFFLTKIHERHVVLLLPFLFVLLPYFKKRIFIPYFIVYSLYGIWNLAYVWRPFFLQNLFLELNSQDFIKLAIFVFGSWSVLFIFYGVVQLRRVNL